MKNSTAEILREYGSFEGVETVAGFSFDGQRVWFASGERLNALDPGSGEVVGAIEGTADAGTAFDGRHLYQIADAVIRKIDPGTGEVLATIPAPGNGGDSGLAWAEGTLWVGQHRDRCIHQIDSETGAVLERLDMPAGTGVSGLESGGGGPVLFRQRKRRSGESRPATEGLIPALRDVSGKASRVLPCLLATLHDQAVGDPPKPGSTATIEPEKDWTNVG